LERFTKDLVKTSVEMIDEGIQEAVMMLEVEESYSPIVMEENIQCVNGPSGIRW
jgi:hypothetical protein